MTTYVGVEHRLDLSVHRQLAQVPVPVQERLATVQDLHAGRTTSLLSLCFLSGSSACFRCQNEEGIKKKKRRRSNKRRLNAKESDWKLPRKTKVHTKGLMTEWSRVRNDAGLLFLSLALSLLFFRQCCCYCCCWPSPAFFRGAPVDSRSLCGGFLPSCCSSSRPRRSGMCGRGDRRTSGNALVIDTSH